MIPTGGTLNTQDMETVAATQPSRTWRLDVERGRVSGFIDGVEAVKQAVFKILNTERFSYLIYDSSYGFEGHGLVGKDRMLVQSELRRRIREALMQDDRIMDIERIQVEFEGDAARVQFTVVSDFGSFDMEVTQGV
jgi:hypothetical protein